MFPVVLKSNGWKAAVFGGGKVAERRVIKLLKAGMLVEVFSREFTEGLVKNMNPCLTLITVDLKKGMIGVEGYNLIFIATDDASLNDKIEGHAKAKGGLVNRADKVSDFIVPATLEMDDVTISVSTTGKSPAMAKEIKKRLKKVLTKEDLLSVELQEYAREMLKEKVKNQDRRRAFLREIMRDIEVTGLLGKGDVEKARKAIRRAVHAYSEH
ncbi:MAG: bifunctional precorrin-2 dehydrogenase/sirohydrochlorin ferrochelatase [Candidatus Hydrothermarchaeota archaeon]|nr:bifunctional precorrin-2 dehydrogenase/sirohydrochlorin ferrochelatase [Candidatus Hydrothermarchaeota archaeon]MDP6612579.1 bifunctional precorrin-2 dehydrogenase/sirohydrochlorin ferrochelatase [Candidatus Hydrothermarchaeota archaeon]